MEENTAMKEACIWCAAAWLVLRDAEGTGWPAAPGQERAGDVRDTNRASGLGIREDRVWAG